MERVLSRAVLAAAAAGATLLAASTTTIAAPAAGGANERGASAEHARIVGHWTAERRAAAIPRELVIDERGLGYLRKPDGSLQPYGHSIAAAARAGAPTPMAKPGGDTTAPTISNLDPATGSVIGAAHTFKATVTDASGLRSVSFRVGPQGGQQQTFNASAGANNVYTVNLSGFTNGDWTWSVVAKDKVNNTRTSPTQNFEVNTSGGGGGGGGNVVTNGTWTAGGVVQDAVGRIYFEMPDDSRLSRWAGYVCSGTVVTDNNTGRSVIQTAAHCVFDDAYKAFARNVLFIPYQDGTTGSGTDLNCANDPYGCWTTAFGVVDADWTTRTFPNNVAWDYAYYVVANTGAHTQGLSLRNDALDVAVVPMSVKFTAPTVGAYTHALGYSYSEDPNFKYCAENLANLDAANWWLGSCGLSGGSSGGPWIQSMSGGNGSLISVNSWGYTNQPGMAGPKLSGNSAQCVFNAATSNAQTPFFGTEPADGAAGYKPTGC